MVQCVGDVTHWPVRPKVSGGALLELITPGGALLAVPLICLVQCDRELALFGLCSGNVCLLRCGQVSERSAEGGCQEWHAVFRRASYAAEPL